ncbi:hypothetical protein DVH24_021146 [Malus domestica]|uniref:Hydroxyproline O-arabinosyltransferase-like domain-containing protein n=1 Tax=Malus domestica TaxID=3750 RepID=A0A498JE77_MALDO|nr:hypothetical protein DVH24_021146 [Malus domestica]
MGPSRSVEIIIVGCSGPHHPDANAQIVRQIGELQATVPHGGDSLRLCLQHVAVQDHNEPGSEMGGFTRILHNGKPDEYMDEIPTFIAQPLPAGMDRGYIVLNRPWAFVQWLQQADIKEEYALCFTSYYILMSEPDHESLKKIAPTWMNVSLAMKKDPETDKAFGWVLEMYAYAVASAHHGVGNILYKDFMLQPPWDKEIGKKFIIHYTYGCDYNMKGELTYGKIGEWRFDKRSYDTVAPPRNLPMPPHGVPESVVTLVKMVNEATANIPSWGE